MRGRRRRKPAGTAPAPCELGSPQAVGTVPPSMVYFRVSRSARAGRRHFAWAQLKKLIGNQASERSLRNIVAGTTHPLTRQSSVDRKELALQSWVLAPTDSIARSTLEHEIRSHGFPVPEAAIATYAAATTASGDR